MKGKITRVSKLGNIQLNNDPKWYNLAKNSRVIFEFVDLNKEVELILDEDGLIRDYMTPEIAEIRKENILELNKSIAKSKSKKIKVIQSLDPSDFEAELNNFNITVKVTSTQTHIISTNQGIMYIGVLYYD